MKASVIMAGCAIMLLFTFTAISESQSPVLPPGVPPPPRKPESDSEKQSRQRQETLLGIWKLLASGRDRTATGEWEQFFAVNPHSNTLETLAWDLAKAYVRLGKYDEAIAVYKPHYHVANESVEQRAELGEILLFGEVGATPTKVPAPIGKSQCLLCHGVSKNYSGSAPYLNLYGVVKRAALLVASPEYQQRPKDTVQPEAFPGSGFATSALEYLAESNVCPSCYVVPGYGSPGTGDSESPMPAVHKPPISLTIDEMIAIDTWLFKSEGEEVPPLEAMRAAYEKFLPSQDHRGSYEGIRLASLYDAKGDLEKAIQLLDKNYTGVPRYESNPTPIGPPLIPSAASRILAQLRDDPNLFVHLKQKPEIVSKFPELLKVDTSGLSNVPKQ